MGKRGKGSPRKVEKPGDNEKGKLKPVENAKSKTPLLSTTNGSESDSKLKSSKVVIDYNCRLLAEEALCKTRGEEKTQKNRSLSPAESVSTTPKIKKELKRIHRKTSSTKREGQIVSHRREGLRQNQKPEISQKQKPQISKSDQTVSPRAKGRRKALTRALRRLRTHRPAKKTQKSRVSRRLSSPVKRSLRIRNPSSSSPEKASNSNCRKSPPKQISPKMDRHIKESMEREGSPNAASNNTLPSSSESEDYTDGQINLEGDESDSDDDIQMQVLEKQVLSDKEEDDEDDGPPDVSLNLPDDTDEESSLLSPSALPASQLFRSPSSRRKKRKSLSDAASSDNPKKQEDVSTTVRVRSPTPTNPTYTPRASTSVSSAQFLNTASPMTSHSTLGILAAGSLGPLPEKRGRGRPRKAPADLKSSTSNLYRKKLAERMALAAASKTEEREDQYNFELHHQQQQMLQYTSSMLNDDFDAAHQMDEFYSDETGLNEGGYSADPENIHQRLQRWKDRSTFVYARHKFVSNENKFRCDVCQVSFTALSSLKRHYGTIYHKQQEAAGGSTLDLSDILRPDREDNLDFSSEPPSCHSGGRGRGRGRPPLARTTSFVRRNAVDSIKKYYAAADAARRRRENFTASTTTTTSRAGGGFTSSWIQKQQRKRKPLLHSDYLYPSASTDSEVEDVDEDDDDDDFGCEDDENNENDSPENGNGDNSAATDIGDEAVVQTPWLSNVWKGIGPPHFTCEVCGESYTKKFEFTKHLFQHRQEEAHRLSLTCPDCLIVFQNEHMLEQHFNLFNHGIGVIREGRVAKDVKKLTCPKCNSKFTRRDYYKKHLEVHKRPLMRCPHCPKKFNYKFYLSDHIKAKHDGWNNNLPNSSSSNNNGLVGANLTTVGGNNASGGNPISFNPNTGTHSGVPKPKVELYSSTTPLLLSTETNKRKNSTIASSSTENFPYDDSATNNDFTTSKKKNTTTSGQRVAATPEIPVPKFITCDAFPEDRDITIGSRVDYNVESNINKTGCESNETSVALMQSTHHEPPASSLDHPKKEIATLLQKFLDSQQDERDKDKNPIKPTTRDVSEITNANTSSTPNSLSGLGHSTTEDGKIVFQLEHSMFKGFAAMKCIEGDENACNMSPLTIEIPRDNINIDADGDGGNEVNESETSNEDSSKLEETAVDTDRQDDSSTSQKILQTAITTEENEKSSLQHCTNSNSSTLTISSASQFLGCGAKPNPNVQIQPDNELQCQDCGKMFEHKKSLIKHVRYYSQGESYPCLLCGKSFKLKHHVSRHVKSFHNVDTSSTTSSASDDTHLEEHGDIDYLTTPSATGRGSTSGSSSSLLATHSSSSSITAAAASVSLSPAKRSLSTDKSPSASATHHQKERARSASDAGRKKEDGDPPSSSSFSKSNYTTVVDSSGATVFKCLICKKLYPSKHQLSSHLSYHKRTISPYKCTVCSAEFKFKQDLTAHQEVHNSERIKFICEKCPSGNKIFLSRKDLLKHMREKHHHLGRKPLPYESQNVEGELLISRCPFCPLVFPQASDMQAHISQEHHDRQAVVCRRCGQVLGCAELLKEHMIQDHQMDINDGDDELAMIEPDEIEEDDDQPPTPSPHTSPIQIMSQPVKADDDKQEEDPEPSSPELELLEVN